MTRLSYFAFVSLVIPGALIAAAGCHPSSPTRPGPPYDNKTCSIHATTWAEVPKGDWLTNPAGATPFINTMMDAGCSTPSIYKPCAASRCDFPWPMTNCPEAKLAAITVASNNQIQSFDGGWDKCTGAPPARSTGITWKPGPELPGGGCHMPVCGE
jgi:hypothetical protein